MSIAKTLQIESISSEDTFEIGKRFGSRLKGGEVIVLSSDLGGGKTTFTKGLAVGLGSKDHVVSPTFTVSRIYKCENGLYLHHFDFYRLNEPGVIGHELADVIGDPASVIVIEWGDIVTEALPADRIMVSIKRVPTSENHRSISFSSPPGLEYVYNDNQTKKSSKGKK